MLARLFSIESSSVAFNPILFILAGNEDMHKISDEFEFWPDRTTNYGVSCPWASKKFPIDLHWENGVSMLARSFFIKSSSKLLVTRTGIKAWSNSILGRIRLLILELLALEWRKFHTFELEYLWSQLVNLGQVLCLAALGWGKGCVRFWGRLDHSGERSLPFGYLFYYAPNFDFEEVEGAYWFDPLCASMGASVHPLRFAYGQEWLEIGFWNLICEISMKNKRTHILFLFFCGTCHCRVMPLFHCVFTFLYKPMELCQNHLR